MKYLDNTCTQRIYKFAGKAMKAKYLSKKEEYDLLLTWKKKHDIKALSKLIYSYQRLVISIAFKLKGYNYSVEELIQEGNIGIMIAAKKFDTKKNVRFSTYASWWIKSYIYLYIFNNCSIVKMPSGYKKIFFNLKKVQRKIENVSNNYSGISLEKKTAEIFGVESSDIENINNTITKGVFSLDHSYNEDVGFIPIEFLVDKHQTPAEALLDSDFKKIVNKSMNLLTERERFIIKSRYFMDKTLEDIGYKLKISKERVRQIQSSALLKLQKKISLNYGKQFFQYESKTNKKNISFFNYNE